jgi:hypothetical protein
MTKKNTGQCACGAVKFEFDKDPDFIANCHCLDCNRAPGREMASFFTRRTYVKILPSILNPLMVGDLRSVVTACPKGCVFTVTHLAALVSRESDQV